MIDWLIPIGLFWVLGAVFFGGMYDVAEGSSARQFLGLMLMFVLYLFIFWLLRLALGGTWGIIGRLVIPVAIPTMFLGRLGMLVFKLLGVRVERVIFGADAH